MFANNKTKSSETPTATPRTPAEAIRGASTKPGGRAAASIICVDMDVTGSINSKGALHIDGNVEGDVHALDVTIGAEGVVEGEVAAEVVKVKGTIKGSIRARKVELETGARVEGDIVHASLSIQPNAIFEGQVRFSEDPLKDSQPQAALVSDQSGSNSGAGASSSFSAITAPSTSQPTGADSKDQASA